MTAPKPSSVLCAERYEPAVVIDRATHTCCRLNGHDGPHLCPRCGSIWECPGGTVTVPHRGEPAAARAP